MIWDISPCDSQYFLRTIKSITLFQQALVDLVPVPAVIHEAGLHDFPSNTKKVAENQGLWYKQFAR